MFLIYNYINHTVVLCISIYYTFNILIIIMYYIIIIVLIVMNIPNSLLHRGL